MAVLIGFVLMVASSLSLAVFGLIGRDFFPTVDAGQIRLHVRARPGTRLEESERIFAKVENVIRDDIPPDEIQTMLDDIGIPNSGINLALSDGSLMSSADGEILIALKPGHHGSEGYMDRLSHDLAVRFPELIFFFAPADIVTQVLNFGVSAPIDIQIEGRPADRGRNLALARRIAGEVKGLTGAADVRLQQVPDAPTLFMSVDRTQSELRRPDPAGRRQRHADLPQRHLPQQNPNFWADPKSRVQYGVLVQTPPVSGRSRSTPCRTSRSCRRRPVIPGVTLNPQAQLLGSLATLNRGESASNITHHNPMPTYDILAGVRGMDLNSVAKGVRNTVGREEKHLQPGTSISVRGPEVRSMQSLLFPGS